MRMLAILLGILLARSGAAPVQNAGVRVSGQVRGIPAGMPTSLLRVEMISGEAIADVPVQADGAFEFSNVPPGNARMWIELLQARTAISVADKDVDGITLSAGTIIDLTKAPADPSLPAKPGAPPPPPPPPGPGLLGRIIVEGEPRLPSSLNALTIAPRLETKTGGTFPAFFMRADGVFEGVLRVPAGEHRIRVDGLPQGYTVKSMRYGGGDVLQAPLRILPDSAYAFLEITLTAPKSAQPARSRPATLVVSKSGNPQDFFFDHGAFTCFLVSAASFREERHLGIGPGNSMNLDSLTFSLPAGSYELRSYVRAFSGGGNKMAPPVFECVASFTVREGETLFADRVGQARSCTLKLSNRPFR